MFWVGCVCEETCRCLCSWTFLLGLVYPMGALLGGELCSGSVQLMIQEWERLFVWFPLPRRGSQLQPRCMCSLQLSSRQRVGFVCFFSHKPVGEETGSGCCRQQLSADSWIGWTWTGSCSVSQLYLLSYSCLHLALSAVEAVWAQRGGAECVAYCFQSRGKHGPCVLGLGTQWGKGNGVDNLETSWW